MAAAAHAQVVVRLGQAQLVEKDVGHLGVVVLAGVDDAAVDLAAGIEGAVEGADLHEVGAGAYYGEDFDHGVAVTR